MTLRLRLGLVVLCAVGLSIATSADAATTTTTPFTGITLHQRVESVPRPLKINVAEIDLTAPGIDFRVTPSNRPLPEETTNQTTRNFLIEQQAQLAINGSFFTLNTFPYANNSGLVVSDGDAYSPFSEYPALNISDNNVATIIRRATTDPTNFASIPSVNLWNAVSGNERIVTNGVNSAGDTALHPRTAAGVAGNRLVLITVDGRQPGISEGVTTIELANLLLEYGVQNAINLDGGGSTTMAIADPLPRLVNVPVGISNIPGSERPNGTNLAIFASPIPEPSGMAVVLLVTFAAAYRRRHQSSSMSRA